MSFITFVALFVFWLFVLTTLSKVRQQQAARKNRMRQAPPKIKTKKQHQPPGLSLPKPVARNPASRHPQTYPQEHISKLSPIQFEQEKPKKKPQKTRLTSFSWRKQLFINKEIMGKPRAYRPYSDQEE